MRTKLLNSLIMILCVSACVSTPAKAVCPIEPVFTVSEVDDWSDEHAEWVLKIIEQRENLDCS